MGGKKAHMKQETPKTRKPVQQRGIQTKDRILQAAERLFSKKGFHKTNTKEIAAEAGVATGSFYAYFKDKKSVFLKIYQSTSHLSFSEAARHEPGFSNQNSQEIVLALLKRLVKEHTLSPDFRREVSAMRYSDKDVEAIHTKLHADMRAQLVETLRLQKKKIRVTDLDAAAFVILCACEEVIHSSRITKPEIEQGRLLANLADMIARFIYE